MTDKPTPDGYVRVQYVHPINPMPVRDLYEGDYFNTFPFAEMNHWKDNDPRGLIFYYADHMEVIPWHNVHNYDLHFNSKEYRVALDEFKFNCEHDWHPEVAYDEAGEPYNYKLCPKCESNDAQIRNIEQKMADRERGLA